MKLGSNFICCSRILPAKEKVFVELGVASDSTVQNPVEAWLGALFRFCVWLLWGWVLLVLDGWLERVDR